MSTRLEQLRQKSYETWVLQQRAWNAKLNADEAYKRAFDLWQTAERELAEFEATGKDAKVSA